jgi:hypothetical protein
MTTPNEYTGSCLCGRVTYKIVAHADRFYHCFCERCRKATGTGNASNLVLTNVESAAFTQGEDNLTRFKLPEAKRFSTCFCKTCGSNMPRIAPDLSLVIIPAGSLDHEPQERPQAQIFHSSGAKWAFIDAELPAFTGYPQ